VGLAFSGAVSGLAGRWPTAGFESGESMNRQVFRIALPALSYSAGHRPGHRPRWRVIKVPSAFRLVVVLGAASNSRRSPAVSRTPAVAPPWRLSSCTCHRCRGVQGRARMEDTSNTSTIKEVALAHPTRFVGSPTIIGPSGYPSRNGWRCVVAHGIACFGYLICWQGTLERRPELCGISCLSRFSGTAQGQTGFCHDVPRALLAFLLYAIAHAR